MRRIKTVFYSLDAIICQWQVSYRLLLILIVLLLLFSIARLSVITPLSQTINQQDKKISMLTQQLMQVKEIKNQPNAQLTKQVLQEEINAITKTLKDIQQTIKQKNVDFFYPQQLHQLKHILLQLPDGLVLNKQQQTQKINEQSINGVLEYQHSLIISGSQMELVKHLHQASSFFEKIHWQKIKLVKNARTESSLHIDFTTFVIP